jgi:hypothetical protein
MLPPRTGLDPLGYYARLGVEPMATQAAIVTAFRAKARTLHPDVPATGNAEAFVAVKQAYDVLSNRERREAYDRQARLPANEVIEPAATVARTFRRPLADLGQPLEFSRIPVMILAGLGVFLCVGLYEVASHLSASSPVVSSGIRPNAATVEPLSPSAHRAVLYGPIPLRLAGTPNFYVTPAGSPTVLWRRDSGRNALVPSGHLPPFSQVQAVRLIRQNGMLEVLVDDRGNGFVSADHLTAGDAEAARSAYCGYNSGPTPFDGELLERRGSGNGALVLENRAVQPAVVKLRNGEGATVVAVFLAPGGRADLGGLPEGTYRPEFAIGELWSRACNLFAAGMRARRMDAEVRVPGDVPIVVAPDGGEPRAVDISDQAFERE